jgi:hypothetical protein
MSDSDKTAPVENRDTDTAEEILKLGITRVPVDVFRLGDFRYTNLKDAIAQAKRQQRPA